MSFQTFERAFLPLKNAETRIKNDLKMATISLFYYYYYMIYIAPISRIAPLVRQSFFKFNIQSVTNKNKNSNIISSLIRTQAHYTAKIVRIHQKQRFLGGEEEQDWLETADIPL